MTVYSVKDLEYLVGLDQVPLRGPLPAVWWVTVEPELLDAYDRWKADYAVHYERVRVLAESIGVKVESGRTWSFNGRTELSGFTPPHEMLLWAGHPEHVPVPAGWRLDRKEGRLVPSRRTKADRESQVNRDWAAVKRIPDVQAYMRGLPNEIMLSDREFGGTMYKVVYWRGVRAVMAYTGADPDRSEDKLEIDRGLWHRQKLSALATLRERAAEREAS